MDALESAGIQENVDSFFYVARLVEEFVWGVQGCKSFPAFSGICQLAVNSRVLWSRDVGLRGFVLEKSGRQGVWEL